VLQQAVEHARSVEPGDDREPAGNGGWLQPADLLHPADIQLQVPPAGSQRVQAALSAPRQGSSANRIRCPAWTSP
jgi:hypothetical protein